ncbi:AAA family ATPase [Paenibacillus sanguinis]|uniref:AAA family ATPase n=1 Tax=Paenibacillus sanguinis TaxID=225906 RepID=UPI00036C2D2A|nr:AAA family ATPase [Paenibacillus sanguinis]
MKLERMQIRGFGRLNGLEIELPGPITVLHGPNEAGKSTLLGFVRAMLFGIPSRSQAAERYEPLQGGVHGGALTLVSEDGSRWMIERYTQPPEGRNLPGTRGDRLRITRSDENGQVREVTQEQMQRELLGGMSKAMFRQLFAVSLTELQEVGALQSGELSRYLFHAGIGGGAAVLRGEKKLVQEMDKLYRPRGRTQEIAKLLQELERLEREAEAAKALLPRYNDVLEELEVLAGQLADNKAERKRLSLETARWSKAVSVRADWLHRQALRAELAALPEVARFPGQGAARWQALQAERERLQLEQNEWARRRKTLLAEQARHVPDERVLAQEPVLRQLAARLPGYEAGQAELAKLEAESAQLEARLGECLRSIHPDWRTRDLRGFAGTVGERESVRRFQSRFTSYDREMELLRSERYKLERAAANAEAAHEAAAARLRDSAAQGRQQFAMLVPEQPSEVRVLWNELRAALDRWRGQASARQQAQRDAEVEALAHAQVRGLSRRLLAASSALTLGLPAVLWLTADSPWSAVFAGALLLGLDAYLAVLAFRGRPAAGRPAASGRSGGAGPRPDGRRPRRPGVAEDGAETSLAELLARLIRHPYTAAGGVASRADAKPPGPVNWDEEERQLRRLMEEWLLWEQRHTALESEAELTLVRMTAAKDELQAMERELARREEVFGQLAGEWEEWLAERRLSVSLSPEAALEVFRLAEHGRELLGRYDALTEKCAGLQEQNERFEQECCVIFQSSGVVQDEEAVPDEQQFRKDELQPGGQGSTPSHILHRALEQLERELVHKRDHDQLGTALLSVEEEGRRLEDRMQQVLHSERTLLAEAGAHSGEEFLRLGAAVERRQALERELRQSELVLFAGLDERRSDELEQLLRGADETELIQQLEGAEQALKLAERSGQELQEKRGRLLQEQESLEVRCRQEDLQQQLAEQRALFTEVLDRYAVMAVCHELIGRTRRVYEEERQPAVLQAASEFFTQMTDGVYKKIFMKIGSQELMAEHTVHGPLDSALLSRGTAEQLYLAMRLALSGAVAGRSSLPLLLDDLFVNFDAVRLEGALSVLREVANRQQVVMMTCHEHVVERIQATMPAANIVRL